MMRLARVAVVLVAVSISIAGCGRDKIGVRRSSSDDYKHGALVAAIDKFVKANRTADAFAGLAATVAALRPSFDRQVAREAELRMMVLALGPIQATQAKSLPDRKATLALTVWPTLIAPPIAADAPLIVRDPRAPELLPKPGEDPDQYITRLCGGPLAGTCKRVVPEYQAQIIEQLAIRRATERVRNAVAECEACKPEIDPGYRAAVHAWESLDRNATEGVVDVERQADPDNWPVSGEAAEDDPGLPEAQLSTRGELLVGGRAYGPNQQRIDILRELRGDSDVIALHVHPDTTLAQTRAILADAHKAGVKRVAIVAREPFYPYRRKIYWVADGYGMRANLRPTDSLQLLLHAIDEVAGPGTVARVD
jgi:hypothetical protein